MGNAVAIFSDPFERAAGELLAAPVVRPGRRGRGGVRGGKDELETDHDVDEFEIDLDIDGRRIVRDFAAAIEKEDADADECMVQCAEALAGVVGIDPGDDLFGHLRDFTFGTLQHLINKTVLFAYAGHFWDRMGSPVAEIGEKRLEDWFLAPESPRRKFRKAHCPMDDATLKRAVRECRKSGTNRFVAKSIGTASNGARSDSWNPATSTAATGTTNSS